MNYPEFDYDIVGVGFGPANIAVAIAMEELNLSCRVMFFESAHTSIWQQGMLLENSDIQNHPLRDLVTPCNPRSKYTFVNYLFEKGRLYEHLNLGMTFPYRIEYAQYIAWVAGHFSKMVTYNCTIKQVNIIENEAGVGIGYRLTDHNGKAYTTRSVILAPGRTPYIPHPFSDVSSPVICHVTKYLDVIGRVLKQNKHACIGIVGSSQSAVEAILHLNENHPEVQIIGMHRSFGFRLKDTSPFTGEVYFPEFVDLYYASDRVQKNRLNNDLYYTNYGAVDGDVLDELYRRIYKHKLNNKTPIIIHRVADIEGVIINKEKAIVKIQKLGSNDILNETFDLVIVATGFRNIGTCENEERYPAIMQDLISYLEFDDQACIQVEYDYKVCMNKKVHPGAHCFLNGLCESTHGMGDAGSFSLLAVRSRAIVNSIMNNPQSQDWLQHANNNIVAC